MRRLKSLPWFTRTWVRQEVFAAREIALHLGRLNYDLQGLTTVGKNFLINVRHEPGARTASRDPLLDVSTQREVAMLQTPDNRRDTLAWSSLISYMPIARTNKLPREGDLASRLADSGHYQATDPRDIVYGILGMTNVKILGENDQENALGIVIDYTRSISQVFQDATRYLIRREQMLDVMYLAQYYRPNDDIELPSWCPDWRKVRQIGMKPLPNVRLVPGTDTGHVELAKFPIVVEPYFFDWQDHIKPELYMDPATANIQRNESDLLILKADVLGVIHELEADVEGPKFRLQALDNVGFSKIPAQPQAHQPIQACRDFTELQVLKTNATPEGKPPRLTITTTIEGAPKSIEVMLACVPAHTRPGDLLCHLAGDRTFTILRPSFIKLGVPDVIRCRFIGTAYVGSRGRL